MHKEHKYIKYISSLPESYEKTEIINYLNEQLRFKKQTLHFKDKMNVVMSFIKFLKTFCKKTDIKIYGSFIRNILEKIFMNTSEIGYGDPINHDIDILIYKSKIDYETDIINFSNFISLLRIVSNNESYDFNFYGFKMKDITEVTLQRDNIDDESGINKMFLLDIPHYIIILEKDGIKIKLDMLCYKNDINNETWQNEFNINTLSLTDDGIIINKDKNYKDSYSMFEIFFSILNKTAICNLPFNTLLDNFSSKNRLNKVKIVNQIIWFFTHRIKILSLGYKNIYSDLPFFDYLIEKQETCQLSGNEPPYIKIKLVCSHYISLMGLAGLVNIRGSEWTESIKCPLCRHDLIFEMIDKFPEKIKIPEQPRKEIVQLDKYEINEDLFSNENILYINNLLKNHKLPVENNIPIITLNNTDNNLNNTNNNLNNINNNLNYINNNVRQFWDEPPQRTQTLVGNSRTNEEYRILTLNP